MKALKNWWQNMSKAYGARAPREQALLAAAVVLGILLVGNALLVDPKLSKARLAERLATQARNDLASAEQQLQTVRMQLNVDLDAGRKADLARLISEVSAAEAALKKIQDRLVSPAQMNALLDRMLANNAGLRLISFKSVPPVNLAAPAASTDGAEKRQKPADASIDRLGLYKHGVELRLEGSYADLYQWLGQLEQAPQRLLWGDVRLVVAEYPKSVLSLTVYTLSSEKAWLAI